MIDGKIKEKLEAFLKEFKSLLTENKKGELEALQE